MRFILYAIVYSISRPPRVIRFISSPTCQSMYEIISRFYEILIRLYEILLRLYEMISFVRNKLSFVRNYFVCTK